MGSAPQEYGPPGKDADDSDIYFSQLDADEQEALLVSLEFSSNFPDRESTIIEDISAVFLLTIRVVTPLLFAFLIFLQSPIQWAFMEFWMVSFLGCVGVLVFSRQLKSSAKDAIQALVRVGMERAMVAEPLDLAQRLQEAEAELRAAERRRNL